MTGDVSRDTAQTVPRASAIADPALRDEMVGLVPNLRAFARSLCNEPSQADDLVQETIVKAWANLDKFERGTNLRAWLFTILRNQYYSELRKRRREIEDADGAMAARVPVAPAQYAALDLKDLRIALGRLPSEQREALVLVGAAGMSYEEAANVCGCAVGTIKSRVNRARNRLAEIMRLDAPQDAVTEDLIVTAAMGQRRGIGG